MIRCERCGGHANPGLAHLHGNPCRHLCHACTERELDKRKREVEEQEVIALAEKILEKRRKSSPNRSLLRAA